jgi:hypothetical protein
MTTLEATVPLQAVLARDPAASAGAATAREAIRAIDAMHGNR